MAPGAKIAHGRAAGDFDYDDDYAAPDAPESYGNRVRTGLVRFFEGLTLPATFIENNPDTLAGNLPSTTVPPGFWTTWRTTRHDLDVTWNCCDEPPRRQFRTDPETAARAGSESAVSSPPGADPLVPSIETIPAWIDGRYDPERTAILLRVAAAAAAAPPDRLHAAVAAFAAAHRRDRDPNRALSRVHLLLRALCDLPGDLARGQARVYGGWIHPSIAGPPPETFDLLWPLKTGADGRPHVAGAYRGYLGRPYDPVGELRYFEANFPRRGFPLAERP